METKHVDRPLLEMRGITKRFPGVVANQSIDFDVRKGEIHTILGENGAGKSTLMKILFGLYQADEGSVLLHGKPTELRSPSQAIAARIGMVHQHFMLVPPLTVAENVCLGLPSSRRPFTDLDRVAKRITEISQAHRLAVDPYAEVWRLSVGERQRVEIIKALYRQVELLVLDEPTAVLTPQEVDDLFGILRQMAEDGHGLIFISHKLHEVMALSDRITVLRDGRVVGTTTPDQSTRESLARMMVGRDVRLTPDKPEARPGRPMLSIRNLDVLGDRGTPAVKSVSLDVRAGEIVGIAGVSGNGQRELAEAIAGLRVAQGGEILIDDQDVTHQPTRHRRDVGLSYVPEERMRDGVVAEFTVCENLVLVDHANDQFTRWGLLAANAIRRHSKEKVEQFDVKTPDVDTPTSSLSGGNIQKVVMARELGAAPLVLLACQPTRGVDIGSTEYIHRQLIDQRTRGAGIVLISEDLDEVMGLADRIAVMFEGEIIAIVEAGEARQDQIGLLMAGVVTPS